MRSEVPSPGTPPELPEVSLSRPVFNQTAQALGYPLFWRSDDDGVLDPDELTAWWHPDDLPGSWISDDRPTASAVGAVAHILEARARGMRPAGLGDREQARREAVHAELSAGRLTLLETDLGAASEAERALFRHLLDVARGIEHLHRLQQGTATVEARMPADDGASRLALYRNHRPECVTAVGRRDPDCRLLPEGRPPPFGVYPPDLQTQPDFCETLQADHPELMAPFTAVTRRYGELVAVPYHEHWPSEMAAVAGSLDAAADVVGDDERALEAYLRAAASAFRDGDWFAADAAWAAMNARNSAYYLRVGPDETYWEPCNRKAGFHLTFAAIDPASIAWQERLAPVKQDMERGLASLAGPPYVAREVAFELPDFVAIVLNAADARNPTGATIGQSLPNWGPVAEAGGRTIAMTNLFTDRDSLRAYDAQVRSLVCPEAMGPFRDHVEPLLLSTVLHEAAHNLGPAHGYTVEGATDEDAFGGALASVLEELKAQSAAMWLTDHLADEGLVDDDLRRRAHAADIAWSFGKISEGMRTDGGSPRAYAQLSSIQLGWMYEAGALRWHPSEPAANGQDIGCFQVVHDALPATIEAFSREVLEIKSTADRERAELLVARFVDADDDWANLRGVITDRWLRSDTATFVYGFRW